MSPPILANSGTNAAGHPDAPPPDQGISFLGIPIHRRIRSGQHHTPWISVFMLSLVWFTFGFNIFAGGQALNFTIHRYAPDPQALALITTIGSLLILGPFIGYLSDQVWTPAGRRRPFVIIGWVGGVIGMFGFAFLTELTGAVNHVLHLAHLRDITILTLLIIIVFSYQRIMNFCSPLEAMFMEVVSPHQRGRFFAIRNVLFSLAVTFFYQVLWPKYDIPIDIFNWLGHPDVLVMTGERSIYIFGGSLFLITGFFMIFCLEEVKSPTAPNHRIRDMFFGSATALAPAASAAVAETPTAGPPRQGIIATIMKAIQAAIIRFSDETRLKGISAALIEDFKITIAEMKSGLTWCRAEMKSGLIWFRDETPVGRTPVGRFASNFVLDVFFTGDLYPFYLILVIPGIEGSVWGGFGALMGNDQFGYSKENQALWAFPIQMISMCAITPFAGWYSDVRLRVSWLVRIGLVLLAAACFYGVVHSYHVYAPSDIRELPPMWVITMISAMCAVGGIATVVAVVETVLDQVGREHARAWIALLTVAKTMVLTATLYAWIRLSPGHIPSITSWMVFSVLSTCLNGVVDVFLAPMMYDYIPRSRMGTIAAGCGVFGTFISFIGINLGAWWVVWASAHIAHLPEKSYDYTFLYLMQLTLFLPTILVKVYFLRLILTNRMPKMGIIEVDQIASDAPVDEDEVATVEAELAVAEAVPQPAANATTTDAPFPSFFSAPPLADEVPERKP